MWCYGEGGIFGDEGEGFWGAPFAFASECSEGNLCEFVEVVVADVEVSHESWFGEFEYAGGFLGVSGVGEVSCSAIGYGLGGHLSGCGFVWEAWGEGVAGVAPGVV